MRFEEFSIPRQKFLVSAGLGLVAGVLAACTTYGKKPAASPTTTEAGATGGQESSPANAVAKTSDIPVGSGVIVDDIVVTQPSAGVFKALSAVCTHQGCTVSEVAGGTINCPCHGSKYNLDGTVARGPAPRPLGAKAISVQGDSIVLG